MNLAPFFRAGQKGYMSALTTFRLRPRMPKRTRKRSCIIAQCGTRFG